MLVVMQNTASEEQIEAVCETIRQLGFEAHKMPGAQRTAVCVTGNDGSVSPRHFAGLHGIRQIIRVSKPYKLTSNEIKTSPTMVQIGEAKFGDRYQDWIAGPACVEDDDSAMRIAEQLVSRGIKVFRASLYRPRSNPYNFQGLGKAALEKLHAIKQQCGVAIASEVVDINTTDEVASVADALIVDSHNMQNFALLRKLSKLKHPVILKRGIAATVEDFLMAAEYIMAGGNQQVILCDAGMRSFGDHSAHALDLTYLLALKKLTHLPLIIDPSQASGTAGMVPALARASMALGAHGVMVECHDQPAFSATGGTQAILPEQVAELVNA